MSGGEKTKLALSTIWVKEYSVLILDEPTNHLDLNTIEQLEKAIKNYEGTVIVASHDKYLLNEITNSLLVFENNEIKRINLSYKEYSESKKKSDLNKKDK